MSRPGVGFLPADRKAGGGFMVRPVSENVAVASWGRLATFGQLITRRVESKAYQRWHDKLSIRSRNDPRQAMGTLSGGNQQKVLLARWLERSSRVLVLIEPTRGVDVGARQDIYKALRVLAAEGVAVLISTSDYEEAVQVADRVYVMSRGAIVGDLIGRRDHDDAAACRSWRVNEVTDSGARHDRGPRRPRPRRSGGDPRAGPRPLGP